MANVPWGANHLSDLKTTALEHVLITTTHPAFPGSQRYRAVSVCLGWSAHPADRCRWGCREENFRNGAVWVEFEGLHLPRQRNGKESPRRRTHVHGSMKAQGRFQGWQFPTDLSLPSLSCCFLVSSFQAANQVHNSYIILSFSPRGCISQDGLVHGAVTNSPTISSLQQRFISWACYTWFWVSHGLCCTLSSLCDPGCWRSHSLEHCWSPWQREQEYGTAHTGFKALAQRSSMNRRCS